MDRGVERYKGDRERGREYLFDWINEWEDRIIIF